MPRRATERRASERGAAERRAPDAAGPTELLGLHPVLEALRAGRRELHRLRVRRGLRRPELAEILELARSRAVPVEEVGAEDLGPDAEGAAASQGLALHAGPLPELELDVLAAGATAPRTLVALDGVEDPQNLGAIARVAEASGAGGLVLTQRRSAPLGAAVSRASAGAIEWLPVARVVNLRRGLDALKARGFWVFGCDPGAPDDLFELPERVVAGDRVVVLGAEGRGLRPGVREVVDHPVRVPMDGHVASLNVATTAAVVLFELARRSRSAGD